MFIAAGGSMSAESAAANDPDLLLETLRSLEQQLLSPETRSAKGAVSALLAKDFIEFGRSGRIYDRAQTIKALAEEPDKGASFNRTATEFRVRRLGDGVALLTYQSKRQSTSGETEICTLRSSIWVWVDRRWQMSFHQGTSTNLLI
jgi:hypothetical protein